MGVRLLYKAGLLTVVTSVGATYAFYEAEGFKSSWYSSLRVVRFGRASYAVSSSVSHPPPLLVTMSLLPPFPFRHSMLVWTTSGR